MQSSEFDQDYRAFSQKLRTQQERIIDLSKENDSLRTSLRKLEESAQSGKSALQNAEFYREKLDQALYDNDSLRALINELVCANKTNPNGTIRPVSRGEELKSPDLISSPERRAFQNKVSAYESAYETSIQHPNSSHLSQSQSSQHAQYYQTMSAPVVVDKNRPMEPYEYMQRTQALDMTMQQLTHQKMLLQSDLSKIPTYGGSSKLRARRGVLEDQLDRIDQQISSVRKEMKSLGVL